MKYLVVVDMQNDFIDGSLGTPEAKSIVGNVAQKIREFDGGIVATFDTHDAEYLNTQEGKMLPVMHCVDGTSGYEINCDVEAACLDAISAGKGVDVFTKPTFGSKKLAEWMYDMYNDGKQIEEIVLVGLCTDICVISNALLLKAFLPEVKITVDAACCAGVTPQSHENALKAMKMCQINIENWEE